MTLGWIKLHRKFWEHPRRKDKDWSMVWLYLLLHVTHKEKDAVWKGQRITLKPGQIITNRKTISIEADVNESKVERILNVLKSEQQIEQQSSNVSRLISIINWDDYQQIEQQIEQPVNNERTTNEQPVNTLQEDKESKKGEKEDISVEPPADDSPEFVSLILKSKQEFSVTEKVVLQFEEAYPIVDVRGELRKMKVWCISNPSKRKTKTGVLNFVNRWLEKEHNKGGSKPIVNGQQQKQATPYVNPIYTKGVVQT